MDEIERFGQILKKRREELNLTQNDISNMTEVDQSTIWRIENERVIPTLESLIKLSVAYKIDLYFLLKSLYSDPIYIFDMQIRQIEKSFTSYDFSKVEYFIIELEDIIKRSNNEYLTEHARQYKYFLEGTKLSISKRYEEAIELYIESLKIFNKNFKIENFTSFNYYQFELRILVNLGSIYNRLDNFEQYKEIIEYCYKNADKNSEEFLVILSNYCILLNRDGEHLEAVKMTELAINAARKSQKFELLPVLIYNKALCYYELNEKEEFEDSLLKSKILCESFGFSSLLNTINEKIENYL